MNRRLGLPSTWSRSDIFLVTLVAAHLLLKLAMGGAMIHVPPSGDEVAYIDAAKALSNAVRDLVRLTPANTGELAVNVVGNGWFMPGMPLLVTPLYLVDPDASVSTLRLYMGTLTFGLWLWMVLVVRKLLGKVYACALLLIPSLVPLWVMFTFTLWGDLNAGLVLTLLLAHAFLMTRQYHSGTVPSWQQFLLLGVLATAVLYLRSSTLPLIAFLFAALLLVAIRFLPRGRLKPAILGLFAAGSLFVILLSPWSLAASTVLRAPVLTTTSVPLSLGITFGDTRKLCYGPCPRGEIWLTSVRYSREIANATGRSSLDIQKAMSLHARSGVTEQAYAAQVVSNFDRYLLRPASFVSRFMPANGSSIRAFIETSTRLLYYLGMLALAVAMLAVFRKSFESQAMNLLIKLFSLSLLLQPFVHISHGRYWPVFAPLFGLALGMLAMQAPMVRGFLTDDASSGTLAPSSAVTWMQTLLALSISATVAGLLIFANA